MTLSFRRSFTSAHALALLALTGLIWYATTFVRSPTGMLVRVYAGANWSGVPRVSTVDDRVSSALLKRHWPPTDELLRVRWDAFLRVNVSGVSRFSLIADAGTRLYLDNQLTIDNSEPRGIRQVTIDVRLERGVHALRLESAAVAQPFPIDLQWARRDGYLLVSLTGGRSLRGRREGPSTLDTDRLGRAFGRCSSRPGSCSIGR